MCSSDLSRRPPVPSVEAVPPCLCPPCRGSPFSALRRSMGIGLRPRRADHLRADHRPPWGRRPDRTDRCVVARGKRHRRCTGRVTNGRGKHSELRHRARGGTGSSQAEVGCLRGRADASRRQGGADQQDSAEPTVTIHAGQATGQRPMRPQCGLKGRRRDASTGRCDAGRRVVERDGANAGDPCIVVPPSPRAEASAEAGTEVPTADTKVSDHVLQGRRERDVGHVFAYVGDGINGLLAAWGRADNRPSSCRRGTRRRPPSRPSATPSSPARWACARRPPASARSTCRTGCTTPNSTTSRSWPSSYRPTAAPWAAPTSRKWTGEPVQGRRLGLLRDGSRARTAAEPDRPGLPTASAKRAVTAIILPAGVRELDWSPLTHATCWLSTSRCWR